MTEPQNRIPLEENDILITPMFNDELKFDSVSQMLGCTLVITKNFTEKQAEQLKSKILEDAKKAERLDEEIKKVCNHSDILDETGECDTCNLWKILIFIRDGKT